MRFRMVCVGLLAVGCKKATVDSGGDTWWLLDELGDEEDDGGGFDEDDDNDEDDEDDEEGDWDEGTIFWGELALDGDGQVESGAVGLYTAEDESLLCEVEYIVTTATGVDDCTECSFAFALELGEEDFSEGDCDGLGLTGRTGTTMRVGQSGSELLHDDGSGWVASGESGLEGSDWFFEMSVQE